MKSPQKGSLIEETLTRSIIGAFYTVYRVLGFGFLESIYSAAMERELTSAAIAWRARCSCPSTTCGGLIGYQRLDMLVDDRVIVENKATERLPPISEQQLYSYLRGTSLEVGLLLHFGLQPKFYRLVHSRRHKGPRHS